jgi:putative sigma-54 modulation protein
MRVELTGRRVQITPVLRRLVDERLAKLERLLSHGAVSAQVVLALERHLHRTDVTLHARGEKFLHGCAAAANWEASINQTIDKLAQQAHRVKGKWQGRKRRGQKGAPIIGEMREAIALSVKPAKTLGRSGERPRMPRILRSSKQAVKAMSVADAARQVDVDRDGVVVFRDVETESISVLYRRPNGELTLVETET